MKQTKCYREVHPHRRNQPFHIKHYPALTFLDTPGVKFQPIILLCNKDGVKQVTAAFLHDPLGDFTF